MSSEENYELMYIEPTLPDIANFRSIIKKQGDTTCKRLLNYYTISEAAGSFTFGYISLTKKAQLGRRSIHNFSDKFNLNAFVLCIYNNLIKDELHIQLICSMNKIGKLLIEVVEQKAKEMNIKKITLDSLAIPRLRSWYESLGFVFIRDTIISPNIPKLLYMIKFI